MCSMGNDKLLPLMLSMVLVGVEALSLQWIQYVFVFQWAISS